MASVKLAALPPEEAIAYFRSKGMALPAASFDYRDVWRGDHASTFVVAKAMQEDVARAIREELDRAMAEGRTLAAFQADLAPRLQAMGWWGGATMTDPLTGETREVRLGSMHRLRTIFDTNMRTAQAAGRWSQIQRNRRAFPYLRYHQIDRPTKRLQHKRFDGLVRPVDDPIWARIYPPNGWFCGCAVFQVTQGEIDRGVHEVSPPFDLDEVEWENTRTGGTEEVPRGIHPGFDVNPGMIWLDTAARMTALEGQDNHAELVGLASQMRLRALHEGFERAALVDPAGEVRLTVAGTREDASVLRWDPGADLTGLDLIHSHPFEGLFSDTDFETLYHKRLRSIGFITPQGTFGTLFSGDLRGYRSARDAFGLRVGEMADELTLVPAAERNLFLPHALGLWLDREGIAAYHLTPTGALSDLLARHQALIDRLIR